MILCRLDHGTHRSIHHVRRIADEVDVELLITILLPPWRLHVSLSLGDNENSGVSEGEGNLVFQAVRVDVSRSGL